MTKTELKEFLDEKAALYESPKFIGTDPIQIPHQFSKKEDIERKAKRIPNFYVRAKLEQELNYGIETQGPNIMLAQ